MNRAFQIILLTVVLVVCGCRPSSPSRAADPMLGAVAPTATELAEFSRQSHISLPSSARFVRYYGESGLDSAVWLQFRFPAAELSPFLAASTIPAEQVRPGPSGAESVLYYFQAWLPAAPRHFQYADTSIAPGRCVKCIFDLDDPQTTVVYLMWFTT